MINTLEYVKTLEAAGVDRTVAEAHAASVVKHVIPDLASKADIQGIEARLTKLEADLTLRMVAIGGVYTGLIVALLKLL